MKNANPSSPGVKPAPARPPIPLAIALLFGTAFTAAGLAVFGLQLGLLPSSPGALRQPVMLWLTGAVFTGAGIGLLCSRLAPKFAAFCAVISFCAFLGLFNWIAFGPGDRDFRRGVTTSGGAASSSRQVAVSETEGRLVFGLFAGALDALILFGLYRGLRRRTPATGG